MALITGLTVFTLGAVTSDTPVTDLRVSPRALEIACAFMGADCVGLAAPRVTYPVSLKYWGWYGAYDYESAPNEVWLHPRFMGQLRDAESLNPFAFSILLHETVHYVYYHKYGVDDANKETVGAMCASERLAWSIANTWLILAGLEEHADYHWAERYAGCEL